jgi:D-alanyl-D-alanine carboxypeptidase
MNPHGLPNDSHYSTAYDLALIFRQAMNHPLFADIVRTRSAALRIESGRGLYSDWRMVPVRNTNRLLATYEGARGGKTGFTFKARRCFVGEVDRGGVRLIVAILNSPNSGTLWQDARTLLDYGFARYGLASSPPLKPEPAPVMVRRATAVKSTNKPTAVVVKKTSAGKSGGKPVRNSKPAPTTKARANNQRLPVKARMARTEKTLVSKSRRNIKKQGG